MDGGASKTTLVVESWKIFWMMIKPTAVSSLPEILPEIQLACLGEHMIVINISRVLHRFSWFLWSTFCYTKKNEMQYILTLQKSGKTHFCKKSSKYKNKNKRKYGWKIIGTVSSKTNHFL